MRDLFITTVGSYMWGMEHDKSDVDLFRCYQAPSESFLLDNRHDGGHQSLKLSGIIPNKFCDVSSFEIGHVIRQLLKGNVNFLWGVMSPKIVDDSKELQRLRKIVEENMAKNCFNSINGLTLHNIQKYFGSDDEIYYSSFFGMGKKIDFPLKYADDFIVIEKEEIKKLNTISRTLLFGINFLDGKIVFKKTEKKSLGEFKELYGRFLEAYNDSGLPEKPNEVPFNDYLLDLRMEDLKL